MDHLSSAHMMQGVLMSMRLPVCGVHDAARCRHVRLSCHPLLTGTQESALRASEDCHSQCRMSLLPLHNVYPCVGHCTLCLLADLLVSDTTRLWKPCDDLPPCEKYIWSYGDWVCDNAKGCGGGTAGRNISCVVSSSGKVVADSKCTSPPDNTTQPCATPKCIDYYWKAKELADCMPEDATKPCGRVSCWLLSLDGAFSNFHVDCAAVKACCSAEAGVQAT